MAHMCHFSSKPHNKMCCGGEDLSNALRPLTHPGASWTHTNLMPSLTTVPMVQNATMIATMDSPLLEVRRKSVTILDDKKSEDKGSEELSSPTIPEKKHANEPSLTHSFVKNRSSSDISISSLPSQEWQPRQPPFIGHSVLTDESDLESDRSSTPSTRNNLGLRKLMACFVSSSDSLYKRKKRSNSKPKSHSADRKRIENEGSCMLLQERPQRRRLRGLSPDISYREADCNYCDYSPGARRTACKYCDYQLNNVTPQNSPDNRDKAPYLNGTINNNEPPPQFINVLPPSSNNSTTNGRNSSNSTTTENKSSDCTSSKSCKSGCANIITTKADIESTTPPVMSWSPSPQPNGNIITTKADIESTTPPVRSPSLQSSISGCVSPRRKKKGPAPRPPSVPCSSVTSSLSSPTRSQTTPLLQVIALTSAIVSYNFAIVSK